MKHNSTAFLVTGYFRQAPSRPVACVVPAGQRRAVQASTGPGLSGSFCLVAGARLGLLLLLLTLVGLVTASAQTTFQNPVKSDAADPHMTYYEGHYYLTYTRGNRIAVSKARSVAGLATAPETTVWTDNTPGRCCNIWAPELHLLNGPNGRRWYIYYTADGNDGNYHQHRMHVLESSGTDPLGPYQYKNRLYDPNADDFAIDGTVFTKDGTLYYVWSGGCCTSDHIYLARMSNPWTLGSQRVELAAVAYDWERHWGAVVEAPAVIQRNGKTFITYSGSPCWSPNYTLGLMTNTNGNILDPGSWARSSTPVFGRSDRNGVYGPGHNGFFKSPNGAEDWIVYHAVADPNGACNPSRTARVQQITWRADNTPVFGEPVATSALLHLPAGDPGTANGIVSGGTYKLTHKGTNQCLDAVNNNPEPDDVIQYTDNGNDAQRWIITLEADGHYKLRHKGTSQCLDVLNNSPEPTDVGQYWDNGNDAQRWRIDDVGGGFYKLTHKGTNQCLDVYNNYPDPGTNVIKYYDNGNDAQRWKLELLELPAGAARPALSTASAAASAASSRQLVVSPNPATQRITVSFPFRAGSPAAITLRDVLSKRIIQQEHHLPTAAAPLELNLSGVKPGVYLLQVEHLGVLSSQKVVVQ